LDSNISWGEDLFYLKNWLDYHPNSYPLKIASFGYVDPSLVGIEYQLPRLGPAEPGEYSSMVYKNVGPLPGWYAIDVNYLHGAKDALFDGTGNRRNVLSDEWNYCYFLRFEPIATAGYSIYIYHLTLSDVNPVRRKMGLPELPSPDSKENEKSKGAGDGN
jgi:hypothetical protein